MRGLLHGHVAAHNLIFKWVKEIFLEYIDAGVDVPRLEECLRSHNPEFLTVEDQLVLLDEGDATQVLLVQKVTVREVVTSTHEALRTRVLQVEQLVCEENRIGVTLVSHVHLHKSSKSGDKLVFSHSLRVLMSSPGCRGGREGDLCHGGRVSRILQMSRM